MYGDKRSGGGRKDRGYISILNVRLSMRGGEGELGPVFKVREDSHEPQATDHCYTSPSTY